MDDIIFEWDSRKNVANIGKHGVSFEEAQTVFFDDYAKITFDAEHSEEEERFIIIGMSSINRLLIVCHCYREGNIIRIISARKADTVERKQYEEETI